MVLKDPFYFVSGGWQDSETQRTSCCILGLVRLLPSDQVFHTIARGCSCLAIILSDELSVWRHAGSELRGCLQAIGFY